MLTNIMVINTYFIIFMIMAPINGLFLIVFQMLRTISQPLVPMQERETRVKLHFIKSNISLNIYHENSNIYSQCRMTLCSSGLRFYFYSSITSQSNSVIFLSSLEKQIPTIIKSCWLVFASV